MPGPVLGMVVATMLWGATFVVVRDSLGALTPATVVSTRFGAAAVLLGLGMLARRRPIVRATVVGGLVTGVATAAGYLFQAIGLVSTSAGSSAFLTSAGTLLAGLAAWPILRQRPSARLLLGLAVALVGSALLGLKAGWTLGAGEAWTLLGAAVYAFQVVGLAHWAPRGDALAITAIQAAVASLCTLPFAGDPGGQLGALDRDGRARLAYLVVCGSVAAPWLQVRSQQQLSPGRIGLLFALEPVFGLLFALGLGGERFVPRWWAGAALILGAVVWVEWGEAKRDAARSRTATA